MWSFHVFGQQITRHFTVEDGLPSTEVYFVHQDFDGYMWFCTDRGVSRYNGQKFENFTVQDGLCSNTNFQIFEDSSHNLWFTGFNGTLSYWEYSTKSFKAFAQNEQLKEYLGPYNWVHSLVFTDDSMLMFQYARPAVLVSPKSEEFGSISIYSQYTNDTFSNLVIHSMGRRRPLNYYLNKERSLNDTIVEQDLTSLHTLVSSLPKEGNISQIYQTQKGWFVSTAVGLMTLENMGHRKTLFNGVEISSVCIDFEKNLWVSTIRDGVFVLRQEKITNHDVLKFLKPGDRITAIQTLGEEVLFGTSKGVVSSLYGEQLSVKADESDIHHMGFANGVVRASFGQVISKTDKGFVVEKNPKQADNYQTIRINDTIDFFFTAYKYGFINPHSQEENSINGRVITATSDTVGNVYFSTLADLMVANYKHGVELTSMIKSLGFTGHTVREIDLSIDSVLVVATSGSGLIISTRSGRIIVKLTKENGLASNMINAIYIDPVLSRIWCCTNRGISIVDYEFKLDSFFVKNIDNINKTHGLLSSFLLDIVAKDSMIWVASQKGISSIPKTFRQEKNPSPKLQIEHVTALGKMITNGVELIYNQNDINLRYNAFSLHKPIDKAFYRYRLVKVSSDRNPWTETNEQQISFMNLESGEYIFEVSARADNSSWSKPVPFEFIINPYFLDRTLVRFGIVLSILMLVSLAVFFRFRKIIRENETQLKLKNLQIENTGLELQSLRGQMNPHFIFNALKSIQKLIMVDDKTRANSLLTRFSKLIRSSLEYTRKDFIALPKEIDFLTNYLEIELQRTPDKFQYDIKLDLIELEDLEIPSLLIQPICENAIKHAFVSGTGKLSIHLTKHSEDLIQVVVIDNGIGYYNARLRVPSHQNSLGLDIVRSRLSLLKDQGYDCGMEIFPVDEVTKKGTRVTVMIPCK